MGSVAAGASLTPRKGQLLNIGLWIVQLGLAALFGLAGTLKATLPVAELHQNLPWTPDLPLTLVRLIGTAELAGVLGLILPAATRIRPVLTPLAAAGLLTVMVLAAGFHLSRGEASAIGMTLLLGALAALVAWGRWRLVPIAPRG